MAQLAALLGLALLLLLAAEARTHRSSAELLAFKRRNPCPSTGERRGRCPGYVIDHVQPLCANGADSRENMAWQEYSESLIKDAEERRLCRSLGKLNDR